MFKVKKAGKQSRPKSPLLWLGTNTCGGDALSFMNSLDPGYWDVLTDLIDFRYFYLNMTAEGDMATGILDDAMVRWPGKYILVVEGTVPVKSNGLYSVVGWRNGEPLTALQAVQELGAKARHVIAVGTCASFGGPFAASPNPTGSLPVQSVLDNRVINVPGCPVNPDWMMGTLVHLIRFGEPKLDSFGRPLLFYKETIHNQCQRRHYFDNSIFAKQPGEPWCLYKVGCKGPDTFADCPNRQWSGEHLSWPVKANAPCIGCVNPEFPDGNAPFFEHLSDVYLPGTRVTANRVGAITAAATALGIGAHLTGTILTGRLASTYKKGFSGTKKGLKTIGKLMQGLGKKR
ncbi:hydrogenase small subunit [Dethiobacter alkaliphilus]|uniref:Hydrogenase (NiFe) small subunit HydA n=1 Tax=Dethiobacter alkaliphilus AHT 1 TaxID=555088 RepID=C0GFF8_DETAL|nr:hydrogenase small subunit [Dethiobacter alkaliphilus]EEG77918.1 hydrogenase (NiFe) small subunit HydA [Dethiobacter alkaliphilus AHT 1]